MIGSSHDEAIVLRPVARRQPATCEASSASRSDRALNGLPSRCAGPSAQSAATARSEMPRSSTSVTASCSTLASSGMVISRLACLGAAGSIIRRKASAAPV